MGKSKRNKIAQPIEDKKMLLAILLAAFGLLLFIALALTLPWM